MTKNRLENMSELQRKKYDEIDVPFFVESEEVGNYYCMAIKCVDFDEKPFIKYRDLTFLNVQKCYFHEDLTPFTNKESRQLKDKYKNGAYRNMRRSPVTDKRILAKFMLLGNSFDRKKQIIAHLKDMITTIENTSDCDYIEAIYNKIK